MMASWLMTCRTAAPAPVQPGVQAGDPGRVRPADRAGRQGRAAAPRGLVHLPHRGVASRSGCRGVVRTGRPGPPTAADSGAARAGAGAPPQPAPGGRVGTHQGGIGDRGKSTCALGAALRERGQRAAVEQVTGAALEELVPLIRTRRACALVGLPRASLYRRRRPAVAPTSRRWPAPPNALTPAERRQLLEVLHEQRFCDLPPAQVWARLLDEGTYLASISTMYRLLRAHGESRDRRRQRTHPARVKPQLLARKPNDVWSWDITKLPGPSRHQFYDLYVILDIYSRYAPGWLVAPGESAELAEAFIAATIAGVGAAPGVIHADRGSSMTSKPVAQLLVDLGIVRSHSRPHVSDDNPYSEAQFKTLKYCPAFPQRFGAIHHARVGLLRHRSPDPSPPRDRARPGLRSQPAAIRPPADPAQAARRRLDQPTHPGGAHTNEMTARCLTGLDSFRWRRSRQNS